MYAFGAQHYQSDLFVALVLQIFFVINGFWFMGWESHCTCENAIKN